MTSLSILDHVTSLDRFFQKDLFAFKETLTGQKITPEMIEGLVPQARSLFLRKILSRMLALCCEETDTADQELKVLHRVVGALLPEVLQEESASTDLERQKQNFDKQTAEFSKTIAKKEKIIADQINKSQKHIAKLQKKRFS